MTNEVVEDCYTGDRNASEQWNDRTYELVSDEPTNRVCELLWWRIASRPTTHDNLNYVLTKILCMSKIYN